MHFNYLFIYFPSQLFCTLRFQGSPQTHQRGFPGIWKLLFFKTFFPDGSPSLPLFLSFYLLYFVLPHFEDIGLPFWVSDVLCQHTEVVLWNLLRVQMFFPQVCGEEHGLPVVFLCDLRTAPGSSHLKFYVDGRPLWSFYEGTPETWESSTYINSCKD